MTERVRAILHELGPENWQTKRMLLFEAIVEEGLDPVEADGVLREAAKRLGAPLEAVRRAWQDYLGPAPKEENAASVAVRLALEQGEFWHTPDGEAWATLPQDGHVEHHPLRGRGFKAWLSGLYYRAQGKPLYAQALAEGIETALAVKETTGWPVWATIAAPFMREVVVPPEVGEVVVAADHDQAGLEAARALARRLLREGRRVRMAVPPEEGEDWLDALVRVKNGAVPGRP